MMENLYKEFQKRTGMKQVEIERALDVSTKVSFKMNSDGPTVTQRLALAAIAAGLEPWSPDTAHEAEAIRPVLDAIRAAKGGTS